MLHNHNLMPGFEMMGNPSGYFSDLENHTQIILFADLAYQLASRYIGLIVIITVFHSLFTCQLPSPSIGLYTLESVRNCD